MIASLDARALKATVMLDPAQVAAIVTVESQPRITLAIRVGDADKPAAAMIDASIAAKSLRRGQALIAQHGAAGVFAFLQGRLVGAVLQDAGLVVNVKQGKQETEQPAAAEEPVA